MSGKLSHDDYSKLKDLSYSIGYIVDNKTIEAKIDPANVGDCQIYWDVNDLSVHGALIYTDVAEMFAIIPPSSNMSLIIRAKQQISNDGTANGRYDFEKQFIIARVEHGVKGQSKRVIKLEFIDPYYFYMSNLYISKGYQNITVGEVIKQILDGVNVLGQKVLAQKNNVMETKLKHDSIVIPAHKSFLNFVYNKEYTDSFSFVNNRTSISLMNADDYISTLKYYSFENFVTLTTNFDSNSPFYIKEFKVLSQDSFNFNSLLPNSMLHHFDVTDKTYKGTALLSQSVAASLSTGDVPYMASATQGLKYYESGLSGYKGIVERLYKFKLLESTLIEVTVSGNFLFDLYKIVNVNIGTLIDNLSTHNPQFSGSYVILKIIDKFQGSNFNQVITLGRVGINYKKGSNTI